jgi:hypothetical protein
MTRFDPNRTSHCFGLGTKIKISYQLAGVFMAMLVMKIGIVRMPMHYRHMPMPMSVRLTQRSVRTMRVLMVLVMYMTVLVFRRLVSMFMLMAFGKVQP